MSLKQSTIAMAAAALCAVAGSASVSAQENCTFMYQRVMEAYQTQAPYYSHMLNHYNARCLSGGSYQPVWEGHHHGYYRYDQDRRGYDNDRWRLGW
jgi:hypothetical protein